MEIKEENLLREISSTNNQSNLVTIRNTSPVNSEPYQRAQDKVRDIQIDTTNIQTAGLQDFIENYKQQSDKTNRNLIILNWILVVLTVATVLIGISK